MSVTVSVPLSRMWLLLKYSIRCSIFPRIGPKACNKLPHEQSRKKLETNFYSCRSLFQALGKLNALFDIKDAFKIIINFIVIHHDTTLVRKSRLQCEF